MACAALGYAAVGSAANTLRTGSDRNGSIWCGKWACIFCGLPGGISGQWQALHLYGTETVFLVKIP